MNKKKIYIYCGLVVVLFFGWLFSNSSNANVDFSERVKVSLRDVGNQLLLSNNDSTSLVLPVLKLDKFKYRLTFENKLSFEPNYLVKTVKESFEKTEILNPYRVEVKHCDDNEVAYSYEIKKLGEKDIIPCKERVLPTNCYTIELKFINVTSFYFNRTFFEFAILLLVLIFVLDFVFSKSKTIDALTIVTKTDKTQLGIFVFYPEQNKLVKKNAEISLSKKECELLTIFVSRPNQIIKREELTKKVWEDNGVFVGRSLDTYISKLRKKLQEDETIKFTNIHGVGYKLEINNTL